MKISLTDAGKRFNRDWIFRHLDFTFEQGRSYAITGPNGSGKSTLLQVIAGALQVSEGQCRWSISEGSWVEEPYPYISICTPYLELVEEMNLQEFLHFHNGFKKFLPGMDTTAIIKRMGLEEAGHKQIRNFSSGMKQRVKLAQAIFSDVPAVFLDEPCTNLDTSGIDLYQQLLNDHCRDRLLVVSSNDEVEYRYCKEQINIVDYKPPTP
ncbi:MAG TPA: ATP-binding cassette domain-containing protein [Chitinophagaceae bacterium]|nr:ATP-binding cassette domain-containing protein [Chitinophagaceae bacterium]